MQGNNSEFGANADVIFRTSLSLSATMKEQRQKV
jgi:hypothetical protein